MSAPYTGGCACGAVRYRISDEPIFQPDCQCRDCQRMSGTGHGSYVAFANRAHVMIGGEAREWSFIGDSGNVKTRGFCAGCGSPLYLLSAASPEMFTVHAGSLNDPDAYTPQAVMYRSSAQAWDYVDPALPWFDKLPLM